MKYSFYPFVFFVISIFLLSTLLAIFAFPNGPTNLRGQLCNTENNANAPGSTFNGACNVTNLQFNDGFTQNMTNGNNNRYQGLNASIFNNTITNCGSITDVKLCHEWWFTGGTSTLANCAIRVDADGGASYTNVSGSCPGTTPNPGQTCIDVTAAEAWTCSNFFTASGTRALANLEAQFATSNRPLVVDSFYFNVTYTGDDVAPTITINYPLNTTYNITVPSLNMTIFDTNLQACWWSNNSGVTNRTITCNSNVTLGGNVSVGSNTLRVWANDSFGNVNTTAVTFTINLPPNITSISAQPNPIKGGNVITINASGVSDVNNDTLSFYCTELSNFPVAANTYCTGGNTSQGIPYPVTCTYATAADNTVHNVSCSVYDGFSYSPRVSTTYNTSTTTITTSVISVAGDTTVSYYDTTNNGRTDILVSGSTGMSCRWGTTDVVYSSMSNECTISSSTANCSVTGVSEGFVTRYISCQDSLGNAQTTSQNLDVSFFLDYTAPTTSDNSSSAIQVPTYVVTLTESDNVDSDPTSYYCTSTTQGCTPTTSIDNGGAITYTSSNRGTNYLRYYSVDDAGNNQTIVNKTITINQLPIFTSATDSAATILGGTTVTITTVSSDPDASQTLKLFVCSSAGANATGCTSGTYCSGTGSANVSCGFTSETDTANHIWYAYLFDSANESAVNNPVIGSYTTDSSGPVITVTSPAEGATTTQSSITASVVVSEAASRVWYNLDSNGTANVSMSNISLFNYVATITNLAVGSHNITFYANDSFGNQANSSLISFSRIVSVDTTAPVITLLSPTNASYVSASSVLINLTSNENLNWSGYRLNNGALTTLGNVSLTNWNSLLSLADESIFNLTVFANDTSNNQVNTSIVFYTDSRAPRYTSVLANPSNANQSQSVNCSITWTDGFNITSVIIGENSSGSFENHTISFSGISGSASYVIIGNKLSNVGNYTCLFYATDIAGNQNSTSTTFVIRDVIAPTVTVTSPSNATYNQQNITASILTGENASSAWYSLNGAANISLLGTTTAWNANLTNLAQGSYSIIFYANDSSNNVGNSSLIYFSVDLGAADTIAPVLTITSITNASYLTVTSRQVNVSSNEALLDAQYQLNGGSLTNLTNTSATLWNATLSGLGVEATNTLFVFGNDTSNNRGNTSIIFYSDTVAPRFLNVSATPNPANETQSVICNAYVNDTFGLSQVRIAENTTGSFVNHTIDLFAAGYANYTLTNVLKGTYTCIFYATDIAGNQNSTSTTFTVNDVLAPTITINSPQNTTYNTNSILLSITTSENVTFANYTLDHAANLSLSGSGTSWSKIIILSEGSHNVSFFAQDSSGNLGTSSLITFLVDTSVYDQTAPGITIISPLNDSYLQSATLLINTTHDENISWSGYRLNNGALTTLGNTSTISWNTSLSLSEGYYNLTIFSNDSSVNKNQANKTHSFAIDLSNPQIETFSCTSPRNDSQNISCSLTVSDSIMLNSSIFGWNATGTWQNETNFNVTFSTNVSRTFIITAGNTTPGTFAATIFVSDRSGRINSSLVYVSVLDDTFPQITAFTYTPNTTTLLDPNVNISVNTTVVEDYNLSSVYFEYRNLSSSVWARSIMTNHSATQYNITFSPTNGTWFIRINATDVQGNQNISQNFTLVVENEREFTNSTTIPQTKSIIFSERNDSNFLGSISLNNTGEEQINITTTITSAISNRFFINTTLASSKNSSLALGAFDSFNVSLNTTGLGSGLYTYNFTLTSDLGTVVIERNLNIQTSQGPYLIVSIDTYTPNVTLGQSDISFVSSVTNFGSQDATNVTLVWSVPSGFNISSGNASRTFSILPIGTSGTNSLTLGVLTSTTDTLLTLNASASTTGADSASATRDVVILNPANQTVAVSSGGSSTGGNRGSGGGGGGYLTSPKQYIEVVRGDTKKETIEVENKRQNISLRNVKVSISSIPDTETTISPEVISVIEGQSKGSVTLTLKPKTFAKVGAYNATLRIEGEFIERGVSVKYLETRQVVVVIQDTSKETIEEWVTQAQEIISKLIERKINSSQINDLQKAMEIYIFDRNTAKTEETARKIVALGTDALFTENLIRRVIEVDVNPKKTSLLFGNSIREFDSSLNEKTLQELLQTQGAFSSPAIRETIELAIAAFERGDFAKAKERAESARTLLLVSQKNNPLVFVYLYWPYLLLGALFLGGGALSGLKIYQKTNITRKIRLLNEEEKQLHRQIVENQRNYLRGRIGKELHNQIKARHQEKLAKLKSERMRLRHTRVTHLSKQVLVHELDRESHEVLREIKTLQKNYYVDKKISQEEYTMTFESFNERLAEIEGERLSWNLK